MPYGFDEALTLHRVNDKTRTRLKHPFGQLIVGPPQKTMPQLARIVATEAPRKIVAIGDVISLWLKRQCIDASIYIIDGKTLRERIDKLVISPGEIVVKNPAGEISEEAYEVLRKAMEEQQSKVIRVEGEEDLLVLPAITLAPKGSMIVYGQPHVGLVIVRVTARARKEAMDMLKLMSVRDSEKG